MTEKPDRITIVADYASLSFREHGDPPEVYYGLIEVYYPHPSEQFAALCQTRDVGWFGKKVKVTIEILD